MNSFQQVETAGNQVEVILHLMKITTTLLLKKLGFCFHQDKTLVPQRCTDLYATRAKLINHLVSLFFRLGFLRRSC
ncbi:hypothetical protein SAMN05421736_109110 [Evansella caseinilytica]|uniref:Uncharacterized protein n=1 Tax=Evansella caseinilytica TaxID=1503961 RepID=A0A1H3RYI9_9BACI|nr:hypothetical protein SAMN05421736_109110 [Evansella caseinilytica]